MIDGKSTIVLIAAPLVTGTAATPILEAIGIPIPWLQLAGGCSMAVALAFLVAAGMPSTQKVNPLQTLGAALVGAVIVAMAHSQILPAVPAPLKMSIVGGFSYFVLAFATKALGVAVDRSGDVANNVIDKAVGKGDGNES